MAVLCGRSVDDSYMCLPACQVHACRYPRLGQQPAHFNIRQFSLVCGAQCKCPESYFWSRRGKSHVGCVASWHETWDVGYGGWHSRLFVLIHPWLCNSLSHLWSTLCLQLLLKEGSCRQEFSAELLGKRRNSAQLKIVRRCHPRAALKFIYFKMGEVQLPPSILLCSCWIRGNLPVKQRWWDISYHSVATPLFSLHDLQKYKHCSPFWESESWNNFPPTDFLRH